jgi:hypothetical protein
MIPRALYHKVQDFTFAADREKVSGRMWGGRALILLNEHRIHLQLWFHGSNEETAESLMPHLTVQSVNGYDANWHCLISEDAIWFHEIGWFNDTDLEKHIPDGNPNFQSRQIPEHHARALGFVRIW